MNSADNHDEHIKCSSGLSGNLVHIRVPNKAVFKSCKKPLTVSAAVRAAKSFIEEHSTEVFTLEIQARL